MNNLGIGDLVCYNAAGMKLNTLGLVLDISVSDKWRNTNSILVQWCFVGKYMPRKSCMPGQFLKDWHSEIKAGDIIWHEFGNWFEVVK